LLQAIRQNWYTKKQTARGNLNNGGIQEGSPGAINQLKSRPAIPEREDTMDAKEFLLALAPAMTDADARERFLADPRAVLAAAGLELPDWFAVTAVEGDAPELAISLPPMVDQGAELDEASLADISGGTRWAFDSRDRNGWFGYDTR